jgi:hypothetical protein
MKPIAKDRARLKGRARRAANKSLILKVISSLGESSDKSIKHRQQT